jgi:hypothetical protein
LNQGHARRYPQTSGGANKEKSAKFSLQLDELMAHIALSFSILLGLCFRMKIRVSSSTKNYYISTYIFYFKMAMPEMSHAIK